MGLLNSEVVHVSIYEPELQVCGHHNESNSRTHVQHVFGEVNTLKASSEIYDDMMLFVVKKYGNF